MKFKKYLLISILIVICIFDANIVGKQVFAVQDEVIEDSGEKTENSDKSELDNSEDCMVENQENVFNNENNIDENVNLENDGIIAEKSEQELSSQDITLTSSSTTENIGDEVQTNDLAEQTSNGKTFTDNENEDYYYAQETETIQTGWFESEGYTYYAEDNGKIASGLYEISGEKYYFNPYLIKNSFITLEGYTYYFGENGQMQTGWFNAKGFMEVDEALCYADDNGIVKKGFDWVDGNLYYFNPYIYTNRFAYVDEYGYECYFDENGIIQTGIFYVDGKAYYADDNGNLQYGTVDIDGNIYCFEPSMVKDDFAYVYDDYTGYSYKHYFDANGVMQKGWIESSDERLYYQDENGNMVSGLNEIEGKIYYFNPYENYMYKNVILYKNENGEFQEYYDEYVTSEYYFGADGALQTGIFTTSDGTVYYADETGNLERGFKTINGNKYYFDYNMYRDQFFSVENNGNIAEYYADENGVIKTSWFEVNESKYYADENGKLLSGAVTINNKKYYFQENNYEPYMYSNSWLELNGEKYYYGEDGTMQTGIFTAYDGEEYYANSDGVNITGFVTISSTDKKTYYFDPENGYMLKSNFLDVDGDEKSDNYFDENGVMQTGLFDVDGNTYYADSNGEIKYGIVNINNKKYYFNPYMYKESYIEANENNEHPTYYANSNGEIVSGLFNVNEGTCYADSEGIILSGFQKIGENTYYFENNNYVPFMHKNELININDYNYYFNEQGKMETGFFNKDGLTYYAQDDGTIVNGEGIIEINGKYYYSDPNIHINEFINNSYFDQNGEMKTGWFEYEGDMYYSYEDGAIASGLCEIDGNKYYFASYMRKDEWIYVEDYGCLCYFDENGVFKFKENDEDDGNDEYKGEFVEINGSTYYFDENANKKIGLFNVGNKTYYADLNGKIITGFTKIDENTYYFAPQMYRSIFADVSSGDGETEYRYYFDKDGIMQIGWFDKGKNTYYADNDGKLLEGYKKIDGNTYYFVPSCEENPYHMLEKEWKYEYDDNGDLQYYQYFNQDGIMQIGWFNIDDNTYYADADGKVLEGLQEIGENKYYFSSAMYKNSFANINNYYDTGASEYGYANYDTYFNADGVMQTGWFEVNENKYYADSEGNLAHRFKIIDGNTYYFEPYGEPYMYKNVMVDIEGNSYYFNEYGIMQVDSIFEYNGYKYYADEEGKILSGLITVNGNKYYFTPEMHKSEMFSVDEETTEDGTVIEYYANETGIIQTGWFEFDGNKYYADAEGRLSMGVTIIDGKTYYFTPSMNANVFVGLSEENNKYNYYFGENGEMKIGWFINNGETYYAESNGKLVYGIQQIEGNTYYFENSFDYGGTQYNRPTMCRNYWYSAENGTSYFNGEGKMQKGFFDVEGDGTYYADSKGIVQYGFVTLEGNTYYFDNSMKKNEFLFSYNEETGEEIPEYYFDTNGIMQIGWFNVDGETYYANETGKIEKGLTTIDGEQYYFNNYMYRNSLFEIEGDEYYAGKDGAMEKGVVVLGNRAYYFNEDGKRAYLTIQNDGEDAIKDYSRIIKINDKLYYFNNSGEMVKGSWVYYNDKTYYVSGITGEVYTGFNEIDGNTYYFNGNGEKQIGKIDIGNQSYYFDSNEDAFVKGQFITIDNKLYYFGRVTGMLQKIGWYTSDCGEKYYMDKATGEVYTGLNKIEADYYYFSENGVMQTGDIKIGNQMYRFNSNGILQLGKVTINGDTYYFKDDATVAKGEFIKTDGKLYYYGATSGKLQKTGWYSQSNGNRYYFNKSTGEVYVGLKTIDSKKYYFNEQGIMQKGKVDVGDLTYYFDENGQMVKGKFITIDSKLYYFGAASGAMQKTGWYSQKEGNTYYLDEVSGEVYTGLNRIDENYYYFDGNGVMKTGNIKIGNQMYRFNDEGVLQLGKVTINGDTYYFKDDATVAKGEFIETNGKLYYYGATSGKLQKTGWYSSKNGNKYYFNKSTGEVYVGLETIDSYKYYFNEQGIMQKGKVDVKDLTYYFDENGRMVKGKFITVDNKLYYFGAASGAMQKTGWYSQKEGNTFYLDTATGEVYVGLRIIDGKTYYFDNTGKMQIGKITIGKKIYYFDEQGVMQKGKVDIGNQTYYFGENGQMVKGKFITIDDKLYYFGAASGTLQKTGWYSQKEGNTYYLDKTTGEVYTGLYKIEADYYYFSENGVMQIGDIKIGNQAYRFNSNGMLQLGKVTINGDTYYFKDDSTVAKGEFIKTDGKLYYYGATSGKLQKTGWYSQSNGNKYYFNKSTGEVYIGLKTIDNKKYYFNEQGIMQKGKVDVGSSTYYFDENGQMVKGKFIAIDNKLYYFGAASGTLQKTGWYSQKEGNVYYLDKTTGEVYTGLNKLDGYYYYFDNKGIMKTGDIIIEKQIYRFNSDGTLQLGKVTINGDTYYFKGDATVAKGEFIKTDGKLYYYGAASGKLQKTGWYSQSNGNRYYLNTSTGEVYIGLKTIDNKKYYFNEQGIMQKGKVDVGSSTYYFDKNGQMVKGKFITIDNKLYYFGAASGTLQKTGWYSQKEGNTYYLDPTTGEVAIGLKEIDGKLYSFDENGVLQQSTQVHGFIINQDKLYYYESGKKQTTGWFEKDGNKYYLDPITGEVAVGIKDIDDEIYYFNESGVLQENVALCGVVTNGEKSYLLDKDGKKIEDKFVLIYESDGKMYHRVFYENYGVLCEKRFDVNYTENTLTNRVADGYYYFDETGVMQTGDYEYNGEIYHFNEDGLFHVGLIDRDGKTYCQCVNLGRVSLAKGFYAPSDPEVTYYFDKTDGSMQKTGWIVEDGNTYYVDKETGIMAIGLKEIDGDFYYFTFRGEMVSSTVSRIDDSDSKYYFGEDGKMLKGEFVIYNDEMYYTDKTTGTILTGWFEVDGKKYYADGGKVCRNGKKAIIQTESYIDDDGVEHITGYNQKYYFFEDDGVMQIGFVNKYGQTYYCYEDGRMAINESVVIDGKTYTFDKDGILK